MQPALAGSLLLLCYTIAQVSKDGLGENLAERSDLSPSWVTSIESLHAIAAEAVSSIKRQRNQIAGAENVRRRRIVGVSGVQSRWH